MRSSPYAEKYMVEVPPGTLGQTTVEKFTVTKQDASFSSLRAMIDGSRRCVPAGVYTGLYRNGCLWMSDTPDEIYDHMDLFREAVEGEVLLNGLGLGMAAAGVLQCPEVTKLTAVEIDSEVISLVAPHLKSRFGARFEVVNDDALTWKAPKGIRYRAVWHDIWRDICGNNYEQMKTLHRRYGRRTDWQDSWSLYETRRAALHY